MENVKKNISGKKQVQGHLRALPALKFLIF